MSNRKHQIIPISPFDCSLLPELSDPKALVAGVDEVGRGSLFGPVFAAAVVFPRETVDQLTEVGIKDSKLLSPKKRRELAQYLQEISVAWSVGSATVAEIDQINILQASLQAMARAVIELKVSPAICLVDGKQKLPDVSVSQVNLVKGDLRSPFIAAASIIAKVARDNLIIDLAQQYPNYDLANNKGYGTQKHLSALLKYGASNQHRLSFRPCRVS